MSMTLVEAIERPDRPDVERLVRAEAIATLTSLSTSQLYAMAKRRDIRSIRVGRCVLFRPSEVVADLERNERLRTMTVMQDDE